MCPTVLLRPLACPAYLLCGEQWNASPESDLSYTGGIYMFTPAPALANLGCRVYVDCSHIL